MNRRLSARPARRVGLGALAAPAILSALALGSLAGMVGIYWDIAWHIDFGRDSFFSPPHLLLYASMLAVLAIGLLGLVLDRRETPFHLALARLRLHPGLLVVAIGAALVLVSAPLDELWHRLFGADATLWGPMHLLLFTGVMMGSIGGLVYTAVEARLGNLRSQAARAVSLLFAGAILAWLLLLVAEYEFNVSFFALLWHPVLLAVLSSFALVLARRLSPLPWAATYVTAGYTLFRLGVMAWLMATASLGLAGYSRPAIPLLIVTGLAVDLLSRRRLPAWLLGVLSSLVTLAVNAPLMPLYDLTPWDIPLLLQAVLPVLVLGALAGAAGAATATALAPEGPAERA